MLTVLRTQIELGRALRKSRQLEQEIACLKNESSQSLIGGAHAMQPVFKDKFIIPGKPKDTWYVAGVNGENVEKSINLELPFLENAKTGTLITDGADNRSFSMQQITFTPGKPLEMKIKSNGGFVIRIGG